MYRVEVVWRGHAGTMCYDGGLARDLISVCCSGGLVWLSASDCGSGAGLSVTVKIAQS